MMKNVNLILVHLFSIAVLFISFDLKAQCPTAGDIDTQDVTIALGDDCTITGNVSQGSSPLDDLTLTINGSLTINGDFTVRDNIVVNGTLTINGDLLSTGLATTITVNSGGVVLVDGNVGNGSPPPLDFAFSGDLTIDGEFYVTGDFDNENSGSIDGSGALAVDGTFTDNGSNTLPGDCDSGCCGDAATCSIILPIELISFYANLNGEIAQISWATASETNNEFFTLERSTDGVTWDIIGEMDGAGNSSERLDYSFTDYNPTPGLSYYRLKQTDYDGQFEYFAPVVVLYEPHNLFKVFPNPTVDVIQLTTSSDLKNARILIKDLGGKLKISNVAYSPHQASVDLTALPTGVYILEIVFSESVLSRRIVKN